MKKAVISIVLFLCGLLALLAQPGEYALELDGSGDYVTIADNAALDLSGDYTLEAWINPNSFNFLGGIISKYATAGSLGFTLRLTYNSPYSGISFNQLSTSTGILSTNKWYHIAAVRDAGSYRVYINGEEQTLTGGPTYAETANSDPVVIGADFLVDGARYFDGKIDEVRIWNDVRTLEEINVNMYKGLQGDESNLLAYYRMSNGSGTSLSDNSTTSFNGTLNGNASWKSSGCFAGPGNALDFDGVDDNVWISSFSPAITQGTISFWIKLEALPNDNARLISRSTTFADGDEIYLVNGTGSIRTAGSFVTGDDLASTNQLSIGEWTHVAITADNTGSKLYINGVLDDTGGAAAFSYPTFRIGGQSTSAGWETVDASMDEVQVWNDVRTESEIREYMYKSLIGDEAGLVAYYRFDQQDGTTIYDISGNGNNGVLSNMDAGSDWVASTAYNTWLGGTSSTWTANSNWSRGAISSTDNVGIYELYIGNDPAFVNNTQVNDLYIGNNTAPSYSGYFVANRNLFIYNSETYNGTIAYSYGKAFIENSATFDASARFADATINANAIFNNEFITSGTLTLNASPVFNHNLDVGQDFSLDLDLTLSPSLFVNRFRGNVNISSGNTLSLSGDSKMTVDGNLSNAGTLILRSTESSGNYPSSLITAGSVSNTGSMQLEKWINAGTTDAGNYTWHSIGVPVTSNISAGDYFSGDYMYSYDEASNSWINIIPENTSINTNQGYIIKTLSNKTFTYAGTFKDGNITFNLNNTGSDAQHGYNLIYNPYPSSLDINTSDRTNIGSTIWIWDHVGETYRSYQFGNSPNAYLPVVNPGQGFFVKVADGQASGSITFTDADRAHQNLFTFGKSIVTEPEQSLILRVSSEIEQYDDLIFYKKDQYNDGYKFFSMNPSVPQIFTKSEGYNYCIYNLADISENLVIPLCFKSTTSGIYSLEASFENFENENIWLVDKLTNTTQKIVHADKLNFIHNAENTEDRFELIFSNNAGTRTTEELINEIFTVYTSYQNLQIKSSSFDPATVHIYTTNGSLLKQIEFSNSISIPISIPGLYVVKVSNNQSTFSKMIAITN